MDMENLYKLEISPMILDLDQMLTDYYLEHGSDPETPLPQATIMEMVGKIWMHYGFQETETFTKRHFILKIIKDYSERFDIPITQEVQPC